MKTSITLFLVLFSLIQAAAKFGKEYRIVGYYPNWHGDFSSKVQWDKLTHVYYAFGLPDIKGTGKMESLKDESKVIKGMVDAAKEHQVIPVLSVGGWSYGDRRCSEVLEENTDTEEKCISFAENIVEQALEYDFKGIDIDWEYPTKESEKMYTIFMKKLRELCDENDMILTVAVSGSSGEGFNDEVIEILDFVNIMAYDGDEGAGHSPYSYAVNSYTYWKDTMGVPAEKLVIGVPFYGRPGRSYSELIKIDKENAMKDSTEVDGKTIYYNGIPTMKKKAEFAAKNAGGIMFWELSEDTEDKSLSLLTAIYDTSLDILGGQDDEDDE